MSGYKQFLVVSESVGATSGESPDSGFAVQRKSCVRRTIYRLSNGPKMMASYTLTTRCEELIPKLKFVKEWHARVRDADCCFTCTLLQVVFQVLCPGL